MSIFCKHSNFIISGNTLFHLILVIIWAKTIWRSYLISRQLNVFQTATDVPTELRFIMDPDIYEAMRRSSIKRALYLVAKEVYICVLWTCILVLEWFPGLWSVAEVFCGYIVGGSDTSITVNLMFMFLDDFVLTAFGVPLIYYKEMILEEDDDEDEENYRENELPALIEEHIKVFLISQVIFIPVGTVAVLVITYGGKYLFVYLWLLMCVAWTTLCMFSPACIDPLFDSYSSLPRGTLRKRIEKMSRAMHFPLKEILVEEGTFKSLHSQVYLTGVCEYDKIVLLNTMFLKKSKQSKLNLTDDEILAIICHELGHWKMNHIKGFLLIFQMMILSQVALFGYMLQYDPLYDAMGFPGRKPVMVGYLAIMELIVTPVNTAMHFLFNLLSRRMEFQADDFAKKKGYGPPLKRALCKMQKSLMYFPVNDWLFSAWYFSHPTALQRINKLNTVAPKQQKI